MNLRTFLVKFTEEYGKDCVRVKIAKAMKSGDSDINIQVCQYKLSKEGLCIYVKVDEKGTITIESSNGGQTFLFKKSKPEVVRIIGQLITKSADFGVETVIEKKNSRCSKKEITTEE